MKITIGQKELDKALGQVARAVATKTSLPVLGNVLLATDQGRLRVAATNLEIGITRLVDCATAEEGAITVPAKLLADFIGALPPEPVTLATDAKLTLRATCGRAKASFRGLDAEDFPAIPTVEGAPLVSLAAGALKAAIGRVAFAAARDESRPVLAGVRLDFRDARLTLSAADGFRMSVGHLELAGAVDAVAVTVPARALVELARAVGDAEGAVDIVVTRGRNQLIARTDEVEFLTRLIDGAFPDWEGIVPKAYTTRALLGREGLQAAAKLAGTLDPDNGVVRLTIAPGDGAQGAGAVTVAARTSEVGDSTSDLDAAVEGPGGEIAFNLKYFTEALGALATAQVALEVRTSGDAGTLRPVGSAEGVHIIMPMHLASY